MLSYPCRGSIVQWGSRYWIDRGQQLTATIGRAIKRKQGNDRLTVVIATTEGS